VLRSLAGAPANASFFHCHARRFALSLRAFHMGALSSVDAAGVGAPRTQMNGWNQGENTMMGRLLAAGLLGLMIVASVSTSASAFRCLARGANGVHTWGYGIFFGNASRFALRHCHRAGGVDCRIVYCR
jgi:hypothetical protein